MGKKSTAPPQGGEIVYVVVPVRKWLRTKYPFYAQAVPNIFFEDRLGEGERGRYDGCLRVCTEANLSFIESRTFIASPLGGREMAYGKWVENETIQALVNRLCLAAQHPSWPNLDIMDRVKLATAIVFTGSLWAGTLRAHALEGKMPPEEGALEFVDRWEALHLIPVHRIPLVRSYGPKPSSES